MRVIRRAILPLALVVVGLWSLLHGARQHTEPVIDEHEEKTTIAIPSPFGPPPNLTGEPGMPGENPFEDPAGFAPPPMLKQEVTRIFQTTKDEPEPILVREITIGGLVRLASGELKRTYSGEQGPALCPT